MFMMNLKKITDERGMFVEIFKHHKLGQLSILKINPYQTRGNHYHKRKREQFKVIDGELTFKIKEREIGCVMTFTKEDIIIIPINTTHAICNRSDKPAYVLIWCNEVYNEKDSDTFPEEVYMNPYKFVYDATVNGESLLSLCCGIGFELQGIKSKEIIGVDISKPYIEELKRRLPDVKAVLSPAHSYLYDQDDKSVDVISCIDGLEHMTKDDGLFLLKHMIRVARKKVLVYTQEGYLKNEPHNAWGIEGADEYQTHKSGWQISELEELGYKLIAKEPNISQHGESYNEVMYEYTCEKL